MQISSREKNILTLAGLVAIVFILFSVFPAVRDIYSERNEVIDNINLEIERESRLFDETIAWRDRRTEVEVALADLESQVFSGETIPVIEANIQSVLNQYARESEMTVNSTRLAEWLEAEDWIMVKQEMSFRTTSQANTIEYLQKLNDSEPRLWVTDFSVDRARSQYTGSITVVGFARREGLLAAAN